VSHDRIAHRSIALVVRHVRPVGGLSGSTGRVGQRATDGEDVRRVGDVRTSDRRRLSGWHGHTIGFQSLDRPYRQFVLRTGSAEGRTEWQFPFCGELVEIGRRYHALGGAVLAYEYDGWSRTRRRL